jgi:hypothetical protein
MQELVRNISTSGFRNFRFGSEAKVEIVLQVDFRNKWIKWF